MTTRTTTFARLTDAEIFRHYGAGTLLQELLHLRIQASARHLHGRLAALTMRAEIARAIGQVPQQG